MMRRQLSLSTSTFFAFTLTVAVPCLAQQPAPDYLAMGITRVESGDYQMGIMTLNEVLTPESKADAATIARAHAYRAQAYLGLRQLERARAAAQLALKADAKIVISSPPYSPAL